MRKNRPLARADRRPTWRLMLGLLVTAHTLSACSEPPAVTLIASPAGPGSAEPHLAHGPDANTLVLSWLEPEGDGHALRYSVLADAQWGPARTVAQGANWFVNWADFPSVTPISHDVWAAHWLVKRAGGSYAYDVAVALSNDGGRSWEKSTTPHDDGTATEHGFVTLFPWQDGVGAIWLDGRNMSDGGHAAQAGGMTLRSALITPAAVVTQPQMIDDLVCDCCQTDIALTRDGPIAVYRNRTQAEIRDIYVARHVDGTWQSGMPVADDGWEISGCPVNGPAIAANGDAVAVAWFTAANNAARVRMVRSTDGGATFSAPLDLDVEGPIGRVDVELISDDQAVVSWLRKGARGQGEVVAQSVSRDGALGNSQVIAETSAARPSGFPQMVHYGDRLVFAWTDTSEEDTFVNTAAVPTALFD